MSIQNLIRAAKDIKTIAGPHVSGDIVRRLDFAIAAAEKDLANNTTLRLAGDLVDMVLSHIEGGLVSMPTVFQYVAIEAKARELKEALEGEYK